MDDAQPLVLVVDDDESVRRSLRWLLISAGYSVATFSSGTDMLEHRPPDQPAVLLMDVRMPDMTGLEVKDQLARMGRDMVTIFQYGCQFEQCLCTTPTRRAANGKNAKSLESSGQKSAILAGAD